MNISEKVLNNWQKAVNRELLSSDSLKDFKRLNDLALKLHRIYEYQCNGCVREKHHLESWEIYRQSQDKELKRQDKIADKIHDKIESICKKLELEFYIQGDPRGATLYISKEPMNYDSYHQNFLVA